MQTGTIEIDFEVHKKIEAERRGFSETPNDVLRRLLGMPEISDTDPEISPTGRAWSSHGVTLPHGTRLRATYNSRTHEGQINDGIWLVEGKSFTSPSGALKGVAYTKKGTRPSVDGWKYWEVRLSDSDTWESISDMHLGASIKKL